MTFMIEVGEQLRGKRMGGARSERQKVGFKTMPLPAPTPTQPRKHLRNEPAFGNRLEGR